MRFSSLIAWRSCCWMKILFHCLPWYIHGMSFCWVEGCKINFMQVSNDLISLNSLHFHLILYHHLLLVVAISQDLLSCQSPLKHSLPTTCIAILRSTSKRILFTQPWDLDNPIQKYHRIFSSKIVSISSHFLNQNHQSS